MKLAGWTTLGRKTAMNGWRRPKSHSWINIVHAKAKGFGIGVWNSGLHTNSVTDGETGDVAASPLNYPRRFVAEYHGCLDNKRANPAMGVEMDVAAADTDSINIDLNVIFAQFLLEVDFTNIEFVHAFQHCRSHRCLPCLISGNLAFRNELIIITSDQESQTTANPGAN